ncbi:MAG: M15 family metallopeptidase [Elusimicrobia bacterium]|nr:M15 family metallopeptidase [Elusimicrobiota bacterium]
MVLHKPYSVSRVEDLATIPKIFLRKPDTRCFCHRSALQAFEKLHASAKSENISILILSAYRSFKEQELLFQDAEKRHGTGKGILWVAPAGFSEHHTGYVFDLADEERPETDDDPSFESTKSSHWLLQNASQHGFELSFPRGNDQGISYEPWHWRFVGDPTSQKLFHMV